DIIAGMMDKNPDRRIPTMAAVVEQLRPWCDDGGVRELVDHPSHHAPASPPQPSRPALDETAAFVLDEGASPPGQLESPSQISQGTFANSAASEDTVPQMGRPEKQPPPSQPTERSQTRTKLFAILGLLAVLI